MLQIHIAYVERMQLTVYAHNPVSRHVDMPISILRIFFSNYYENVYISDFVFAIFLMTIRDGRRQKKMDCNCRHVETIILYSINYRIYFGY